MKIKSRLITKVLATTTILFLLLMSTAFADSKESLIDNTLSLGGENGEIVAAYRVTDNGLVKIDNDTLKKLQEESDKVCNAKSLLRENVNSLNKLQSNITTSNDTSNIETSMIEQPPVRLYHYEYNETGRVPQYTRNDLTSRISSYVRNETQDNITRTILTSKTQSYTVNISLNGGKKDAFAVTLGGGWSDATTYSDSVSTTIRPRYQSWIEFTPIMTNSYGYMTYYERDIYTLFQNQQIGNSEWTDLYLPRNVNGKTDGIMIVKTATY